MTGAPVMRLVFGALTAAALLMGTAPPISAGWDWDGGLFVWPYTFAPAHVYDPRGWDRYYSYPAYVWDPPAIAPACTAVRRVIRDGRKRRTLWVRTCD